MRFIYIGFSLRTLKRAGLQADFFEVSTLYITVNALVVTFVLIGKESQE